MPIKVEKAEDSDESDVENYFVEDEEAKKEELQVPASAWTPELDGAAAAVRL